MGLRPWLQIFSPSGALIVIHYQTPFHISNKKFFADLLLLPWRAFLDITILNLCSIDNYILSNDIP